MIRKYAEIFCWKNVSSFCSAKATHIFSAKNIRILYIKSAKIVNEMILNELVKLTTLWTTGPWCTNMVFKHIFFKTIKRVWCRPRWRSWMRVRLESRRSRVRSPPRWSTFFCGDRSWNTFYGHPSADSRNKCVNTSFPYMEWGLL